MYIVNEGEVTPLEEKNVYRHRRDNYGSDWIAVEAASEEEALHQAAAYDHREHPAQTEMEMFTAAYRAGAFGLPGEAE